jgi:hypothetical protein
MAQSNDKDIDLFNEVTVFTGEMPGLPIAQESPEILAEAAVQREVAEVQAAMTIAKRFPRNQAKALERILTACQRPVLAEGALYSYVRGGAEIAGPSIRLAEAIAQQWGNLQFGIRELDQRLGESTVEAYAWDLETNTRQVKVFQVKHLRYTRQGSKNLIDPRDIYEMVANLGARRLRACILGIIPGDVIEAAVGQCEATLKTKADIGPEAIKKMIIVFAELGVTQEMIEARIQRKVESITAAQIINLRKIYNSLKDGMSVIGTWFDQSIIPPTEQSEKKRGRPTKASPPPESGAKVETNTQDQGKEKKGQNGAEMASEEQVEKIKGLIGKVRASATSILADYEVQTFEELTHPQAASLILDLGAAVGAE